MQTGKNISSAVPLFMFSLFWFFFFCVVRVTFQLEPNHLALRNGHNVEIYVDQLRTVCSVCGWPAVCTRYAVRTRILSISGVARDGVGGDTHTHAICVSAQYRSFKLGISHRYMFTIFFPSAPATYTCPPHLPVRVALWQLLVLFVAAVYERGRR